MKVGRIYIFSPGLIFVAIVFLVNTAGVIRYSFKWGDPASSPGYEMVPQYFSLYGQVLSVLAMLILLWQVRKPNLMLGIGFVYLIFVSANVVMNSSLVYVLWTARGLVFYAFVFLILSARSQFLSIKLLNKCIELLAFFVISFLLLQISLVRIADFYPSHSHPDYLVRYGSIYDDSLVLSFLFPMFTGYYLRKYRSFIPSLTICLISLSVSFLTNCITGIFIMITYLTWCKRYDIRVLSCVFFCITCLVICRFQYLYDIYLFKNESISSHLGGWSELFQINLIELLGLYPANLYPEPGYVSLLLNFGIFILVGFIGLLSYLFFICNSFLNKKSTNQELRNLSGATEGLLFSVALANCNFPVAIFTPIYFMSAIFGGVIFYHFSKTNYKARSSAKNKKALFTKPRSDPYSINYYSPRFFRS